MSGIPRWSSGLRLCALLLRAWIQTLVRELRSCKLRDMAWREKKGWYLWPSRPEAPWPGRGSSNKDQGKGTLDICGVRKEERSHQWESVAWQTVHVWSLPAGTRNVQGSVVTVQLLNHVRLFATPWTAACQLPCPSLSPRGCSDSCTLSRWCHPTISSSVFPFSSCLQSFPA